MDDNTTTSTPTQPTCDAAAFVPDGGTTTPTPAYTSDALRATLPNDPRPVHIEIAGDMNHDLEVFDIELIESEPKQVVLKARLVEAGLASGPCCGGACGAD